MNALLGGPNGFKRGFLSRRIEEEPDLVAAFARLEHDDLIANGATEELARDYETADPSCMAVPGAIRYRQNAPALSSINR